MRTLIVSQGLEHERILAAINLHAPNKLIILRSLRDVTDQLTHDIEEHINHIKKYVFSDIDGLRLFPFLTEVDSDQRVDFFDLPSAIASIFTIIQNEVEKGNEVSVDISSGNKIVSIALFLSAQLLNSKISYCTAGKYASMENAIGTPRQIAFSVDRSVHLPRLPLRFESLPWQILEKLSSISEVKSLSQLLQLMGKQKSKSNLMKISRKLDILERQGYVKQDFIGKRKRIRITGPGIAVINLLKTLEERRVSSNEINW